jgi:glutamate/tyrosine decarboxylase-like PLP-dependent enzyme
MTVLRERLQKEKEIGRGVIVSYGLGEVNTGVIGSDLDDVAELCEELGAWLHVDAGTFPLSDVIDK